MYPQNLVICPHCRGQMVNDGTLNGQIVACPHCHGQFQMPGGAMPPIQANYATPAFGPATVSRTALKQKPETDPFAFFCFLTGLISLAFFPEVLMPVCYGCGIVSYYRLKENHNLKGQGWRVTGWIFGSLSFLFLLWKYQVGVNGG